ncbi:MAG: carbohydrate-binding domain-containing protein [Ruminococcus sp.]|nr:carbohydrate-binding domain-containing protein [Ruminococcus sp.]
MKIRKITAGLAALMLLASFASCGKEEAPEAPDEGIFNSIVADPSDTVVDDEPEEQATKPEDDAESPTKSSSGQTTAKKDSADKTSQTTAAKSGGSTGTLNGNAFSSGNTGNSGGSSGNSGSTGNNSGGGSTGNSGNHQGSSGNGNSHTDTPTVTEKPVTQATQPPSPPTTTEAAKTFDAEITFNENASAEGVNVETDGPVVRITAGGDYIVRGSSSNGQIYINTAAEEKVELTLDGLDLSCSGGPAIFVDEAKRCVIKLADGTMNYLSDGGNDKVNDGVIFSNDTLRLKGDGYLELNAGNAHGIASDDDIIIESGEYVINSIKSGMIANDNITLNGGSMTIFGGTNGLKSKGTMNINGGDFLISGGSKEEKSSIYAAAGLYYTGGNVFAAGNMVTAPSTAVSPYIVAEWKGGLAAESTVGFVLNGVEYASLTPRSTFRCVMMLSPDITVGSTFEPYVNGSAQQGITVADGMNYFAVE